MSQLGREILGITRNFRIDSKSLISCKRGISCLHSTRKSLLRVLFLTKPKHPSPSIESSVITQLDILLALNWIFSFWVVLLLTLESIFGNHGQNVLFYLIRDKNWTFVKNLTSQESIQVCGFVEIWIFFLASQTKISCSSSDTTDIKLCQSSVFDKVEYAGGMFADERGHWRKPRVKLFFLFFFFIFQFIAGVINSIWMAEKWIYVLDWIQNLLW